MALSDFVNSQFTPKPNALNAVGRMPVGPTPVDDLCLSTTVPRASRQTVPVDDSPTPGALAPNRHSVLEDALALFEVDLNVDDPARRQAAQLANLCVQVFREYATLMQEADQHLPREARDRIIPIHMERSIEGLSRLAEILGVDLE
ncbi:hypothetical protein OHB05_38335 [Streptomyces sp. NBC_00638]|uniref:hypothetical protein n=1 Tax=unclassified Streptomyces TaxID=2593676 RepID=UPI00224D429C|nr:hypothetical protein [Streptomyces sp. NBC_00638]MCX5008433.1 hypothetical protein [Streptomyces sp. NBC_00638]